ncbi:DNA polymerase III subunit gamma/tau [Jeotgalibaca sp. MA1X17-3]|uniref:DNA polymerase III subunit gamma/tau n=1 Tax=Jeotgalibaca sp. MA1X17-3 TaxID=2908211 RepID=UPI001F418459|nr:DNA polymerase III subunit gamma/tau [Jeotgalibaca sp. MA1X17-3]UJF15874.1 DNA polymerase III subunit gamma/tau [Jeotgalibaca sp. MA1X17-3]
MSYQALYRVWRLQRFEDIAGQEAVTRTLRNALMQQKNSHAYLFTGPRGTGKTSAAKIFAKAINCPNQKDGEPCNECEICHAITEGRLNDVIEIDAASNNGVEEIRDIRDKARYAPTQAEYKIYIIDEVHMLSTGAFNALLKTLEEPPGNVIFILATTEPHKIPLTIISRTQRFDFKRITYKDILGRMRYILGEEKISFDEEALHIIARAANGGMRDALSLLDQIISYDSETITLENAVKVSGSLTEEMMLSFLQALWNQSAKEGLNILQSILSEGKEAGRFVEEMILFSRDILIYKQTDGRSDKDTEQATDSFQEYAAEVEPSFLYRMMEELNHTQKEMRFSTQPEVYLEVLAVKMAQPAKAPKNEPKQSESSKGEIQQLEQEVASLKKELSTVLKDLKSGRIQVTNANESGASEKKATRRSSANKSETRNSFKPNISRAQQIMREASKKELKTLQDDWKDILDCLSVTQRAILRQAQPVAASESACILSFDYEILCQKATDDVELQEALDEAIRRITQRPGEVVCMTGEQWSSLRRSYVQSIKNGKNTQKPADSTTDSQQGPTTKDVSQPSSSQTISTENDEKKQDNYLILVWMIKMHRLLEDMI